MNSRKIALLWSGGCDSTDLLLNLIDSGRYKDNDIITISVIPDIITPRKASNEARARKSILRRLKNEGHNISNVVVHLSSEGNTNVYSTGLPQPPYWLAALLIELPFIDSESTDIAFGYIRQDDIWHYKTEFLETIRNAGQLLNKDLNVILPFEFIYKSTIIDDLKERGYYDLVTYCENPDEETGRNCGHCNPCIEHQLALEKIKLVGEFPNLQLIVNDNLDSMCKEGGAH